MFAAIYSYDNENGRRKHLGNITNIAYVTTLRTFDFNTAEVKGKGTFKLEKPLIYVINDNNGRPKFSGFIKKIAYKDSSHNISFSGEDFKKILDTDILLDFSNVSILDFSLKGIFEKVAKEIASTKDSFIMMLDLQFIIPDDTEDTKVIADYTGQYIIVNALQFLKVYLAFYGYYIKTNYIVASDQITIEFKKMTEEVVAIKLKDFTHEKTTADIKVNKTIATIAYKTTTEEASWIESDQLYYDSQPFSNRATINSQVTPPTEGYSPGFALLLITDMTWQTATEAEYNSATIKSDAYFRYSFIEDPENNNVVSCPAFGPSFNQAITVSGSAKNYDVGSVVRVRYRTISGELCVEHSTYIKAVTSTVHYYRLSDITYLPRPNLPEKIYTLGKNNKIYEGYAPEEERIYPIVTKLFESTYLSEAQLNAVYEIVNNRYVENIVIEQNNMINTLDLASLELNTKIRVYDENGNFKDIPIAEKTYTSVEKEEKVTIKLGFKKTLLTEIIKNDIGLPDVVKSSGAGSGSTTVITEEGIVYSENEPLDAKEGTLWLKPIEEIS